MRGLIASGIAVCVLAVCAGATALSSPSGGPVPAGSTATSVTFVSARTAFVLGTAPCAHKPCTVILRTRDRGVSWQGLPAPLEGVSAPFGNGLWGLRFADAQRGYAFGKGLWVTSDGGGSWSPGTAPAKFVFSLEAVHDHELVALASQCAACNLGLYHRPVSGGTWKRIVSVSRGFGGMIDVHGETVWALVGEQLYLSSDGGLTFARHAEPCPQPHQFGLPQPNSVADDGAHTYLLCTGQGFTGHTMKFVNRTGGTGSGWRLMGRPPTPGDAGELAAGSDHAIVLASASAASWLYLSRDGGRHWTTPRAFLDGGEGWSDLGFTTATDGVVIHGPAGTDGGDSLRAGQLLLTDDGGRSWQVTRF